MSTLVEKLAELTKGVGVSNVYGEATELNGIHVVPVAMTFHAFGAGEGRGNSAGDGQPFNGEGEGSGGGGFAGTIPLGAYVRDIRGLRFEPNLVVLLAAATPLIWVTGRALAHLAKASRKRRR
jgi:uncharacterized spore protein YtfJ